MPRTGIYIFHIYDPLINAFLYFSGVAQGVITGIRGLCNGLGPALFGFIFYLFHVNLNEGSPTASSDVSIASINTTQHPPNLLHDIHVVSKYNFVNVLNGWKQYFGYTYYLLVSVRIYDPAHKLTVCCTTGGNSVVIFIVKWIAWERNNSCMDMKIKSTSVFGYCCMKKWSIIQSCDVGKWNHSCI